MKLLAFAALLACGPLAALAQHGGHRHGAQSASPYAGQQAREIKALSEKEVGDLRAGAGMGLAKAAELNRYPGPMHALEHADRLELTAAQREALAALMGAHKERARSMGVRVIELERELDIQFASRKADAAGVERLTAAIGDATARLRAEHLKTDLVTTSLLTPEQVERFARARGF